MNLQHLSEKVFCSHDATITFLKENGLIKSQFICESCQRHCAWTSFSSKADGYIWRCNSCRKSYSIRKQSWFGGSKLTLKAMLLILYYWTQDLQQDYVAMECEIGSAHTIGDFYMYCRQICFEMLERQSGMLGGPGKIVEIDEAKFGRRKFNKGKRVDGVWMFGCVERGGNSSRCCVIPVASRDEATLLGEIKKFITPGTTILSDCWKAYSNLEKHGYIHRTVNHSEGFKNPVDGTNTNAIEGLWSLVRRSLPKFGTTKNNYASYMCEFMYRRRYFSCIPRNERFMLFIHHLASISDIF
jgi:hypothetical protein